MPQDIDRRTDHPDEKTVCEKDTEVVLSGHIYDVEIDCPVCARKVEDMINSLDRVESAVLTYPEKVLTVNVTPDNEKAYAEIEAEIDQKAKTIESGWSMTPRGKRVEHVYDVEIDCPVCARKVEKALNELKDIETAVLAYPEKVLTVTLRPGAEERIREVEEIMVSAGTSVESGWSMRSRD